MGSRGGRAPLGSTAPEPKSGSGNAGESSPSDEGIDSVDALGYWHSAITAWLLEGTEGSAEVRARLLQVLESDRVIGIATGILMAQHQISRQQASDRLDEASRHLDRPLTDVATQVITLVAENRSVRLTAEAAPTRPRRSTPPASIATAEEQAPAR